jgi:acetaldehyde dehydrogenase/alcohol dehydrogenase
MKKKLNIPLSIKDWGIAEKDWEEAMKTLPELAFDDQCTGANPRYPLFKEIEQMYRYAYEGKTDFEL